MSPARPLWVGCTVVVLTVLCGLWAGGGLRAVPHAGAASIDPGQPVELGRFQVTPVMAELTTRRPGAVSDDEPGEPSVAVTMDVTNTWRETAGLTDLEYLVTLRLPDGGRLDSTALTDTAIERDTAATQLYPDMPERVVAAWRLPAGAPPPRQVVVVLAGETRREAGLSRQRSWLVDERARAVATLRVADT